MADFDRSLAILIGIDSYENGITPLRTAVNDAARLAKLLRDKHDYETILLSGTTKTVQPVTGEQLRTLFTEELPTRLDENDRLLIYFAGHGVASDGDDGPSGYLVPQDAHPSHSVSMIPMTDLHAWLSALPCRHMLLILDCCFAGAFRWASTRHLGMLPEVIHQERYDRYLTSPAWQALTSAAYDQKALDVLSGDAKRGVLIGDNDGLHSPFAQALFRALEDGEADVVPKGEHDGVITATELYMYLRDTVEKAAESQANHEQTAGLWPLNKHGRGEYIFLSPVHPLNLPPAPDLTNEMNPYRGLKSYDQHHSDLFFGRKDEIEELVKLIEAQPIVAVLGPSGAGKSSLAKAGALPKLQQLSDEGEQSYRILPPMRPTDQPLQALKTLLDTHLGSDLDGQGHSLTLRRADSLAQFLGHWSKSHPGERLTLTIDQFEELITLCREEERERFLRLLAGAVRQQPNVFRLIITLRSDFEPQFTQEESPLAAFWSQARYVVPPMEIEALRQAIEGPASVRVVYFDPPQLVNDLIKEVNQTPGALPLLSFTLSELYSKYVTSQREDRALLGADYAALGGVIGSLSSQATEAYNQLPDDAHRATMQRVMLRMVELEGGGLARRRVALNELHYPTEEENERVNNILKQLVDTRLLARGGVESANGFTGEGYVEPAHNALVFAWDKLQLWKQGAQEYLPLQRRLAQAAFEWSEAKPEAKQGLLWDNDPRLPQVEETLWPTGSGQNRAQRRMRWLRQVVWPNVAAPPDTKWLNSAELNFTQASVRRRATTFQRIIGITLMVMVALAGLTINSFYQANVATEARATAEANAATAVSAQGTAEAESTRANEEARRALAQSLAALSPVVADPNLTDTDIQLLLTLEALHLVNDSGGNAGWLAETVLRDILLRPDLKNSSDSFLTRRASDSSLVALSGDWRYLVTINKGSPSSSEDISNVWVWDLSTNIPIIFSGHSDAAGPIALSSTGRWVASSNLNDAIWVWDLSKPLDDPIIFSGHTSAIRSIVFSPDEQMLVSSDLDKITFIWDLTNPAADPQSLSSMSGGVITFSPDGQSLAIASNENQVEVWDINNFTTVQHTFFSRNSVRAMSFSPDGQYLALGVWGRFSNDPTLEVWNLTKSTDLPYLLSGHSGIVNSVSFSSDSKWLATGGADGIIQVWDLTDLFVNPIILMGQTPEVVLVAFSPDEDQKLISIGLHRGAYDGDKYATEIWSLANPAATDIILTGHTTSINSIAFSIDGQWLASAGGGFSPSKNFDNSFRIWDLTVPTTDPLTLFHDAGPINSVAISSNGKWLAAGNQHSIVRLWDVSNLSADPIVLLGHTAGVTSLAFSANGNQLASASQDKTVRIWDLNDVASEPIILEGHTESINSIAFSSSGQLIASGSTDQTIMVWDLSSLIADPIVLGGTNGAVYSVAFSPNGYLLASGNEDKTVNIWDLSNPANKPLILSGNTSAINSITFSPDGRQLVSGSIDAVRVWDLNHTFAEPFVFFASFGGEVAFSPNGEKLAFIDRNIIRITPTLTLLLQLACESVSRNMTETEWERYVGNLISYRPQCDLVKNVPIWWP